MKKKNKKGLENEHNGRERTGNSDQITISTCMTNIVDNFDSSLNAKGAKATIRIHEILNETA